MLQLADFEI